MIYDLRRMIYLRCKYDIISVPSYAEGIYHPPKVGIISKIYHPFREERISLKTPSLYHNEGVFMGTDPNFNTNAPPFEARGCKVTLGGAF